MLKLSLKQRFKTKKYIPDKNDRAKEGQRLFYTGHRYFENRFRKNYTTDKVNSEIFSESTRAPGSPELHGTANETRTSFFCFRAGEKYPRAGIITGVWPPGNRFGEENFTFMSEISHYSISAGVTERSGPGNLRLM